MMFWRTYLLIQDTCPVIIHLDRELWWNTLHHSHKFVCPHSISTVNLNTCSWERRWLWVVGREKGRRRERGGEVEERGRKRDGRRFYHSKLSQAFLLQELRDWLWGSQNCWFCTCYDEVIWNEFLTCKIYNPSFLLPHFSSVTPLLSPYSFLSFFTPTFPRLFPFPSLSLPFLSPSLNFSHLVLLSPSRLPTRRGAGRLATPDRRHQAQRLVLHTRPQLFLWTKVLTLHGTPGVLQTWTARIETHRWHGSMYMYASLIPMYASLIPMYASPIPMYASPIPMYASLIPMYASPIPIYATPIPIYATPIPMYAGPVPM